MEAWKHGTLRNILSRMGLLSQKEREELGEACTRTLQTWFEGMIEPAFGYTVELSEGKKGAANWSDCGGSGKQEKP